MMLPAAWQRISALSSSSKVQAGTTSNAQQYQTYSNLGSRKSSLSSLSLASFASSDTSFTAISYTSHHYLTAAAAVNSSTTWRIGDSSRTQPDLAPEQIFEVDDDFNVDLEDGECCGSNGGNYSKLDCVIEESL